MPTNKPSIQEALAGEVFYFEFGSHCNKGEILQRSELGHNKTIMCYPKWFENVEVKNLERQIKFSRKAISSNEDPENTIRDCLGVLISLQNSFSFFTDKISVVKSLNRGSTVYRRIKKKKEETC